MNALHWIDCRFSRTKLLQLDLRSMEFMLEVDYSTAQNLNK